MQTLYAVWFTTFEICRLRLGPQDLPASPSFMVLALLTYTLSNGLISVVQEVPIELAMLSGIIETLISVFLTSSLLYVTRYPLRIVQTVTAIAATGSILGFIGIPLIIWYQLQIKEHIIGVSFILLLGLIIWSLIVHAHILRHALTVPFFVGFSIAMIILFLTINILSLLFPFTE
jgi:hypothetical protein